MTSAGTKPNMRCPYAAWARRARRKSIIDPSFKRVLEVQPNSTGFFEMSIRNYSDHSDHSDYSDIQTSPFDHLGVGCPALGKNGIKTSPLKGAQMTSQRQIAICRLLVACIALLMASSDVWSQATTSIRGTVSDPRGAVVPGANIML